MDLQSAESSLLTSSGSSPRYPGLAARGFTGPLIRPRGKSIDKSGRLSTLRNHHLELFLVGAILVLSREGGLTLGDKELPHLNVPVSNESISVPDVGT